MLRSLYIQDYVVIESVRVEFTAGLNIITGETGAGKSIIIDAMGLILGERSSSDVVRKGSAKTIIEGVFDVSRNKRIERLCNLNEIEYADELIARREITQKGNSRCFINDTPVSLTQLKEFGNNLVDLHGQHEHQTLLRKETHIDFLDEFCGNENVREECREKYLLLRRLKNELEEFLKKRDELSQKKDFIEFQLREIEKIDPQMNEDQLIEQELNLLENAEKIIELAHSASDALYEGEVNAYEMVKHALHEISALVRIDSSFEPLSEELQTVQTLLKDVASSLRSSQERVEIDPGRLEFLRNRLASLQMIKRKFGGTIESVLEAKEELLQQCMVNDSSEEMVQKLQRELSEAINSYGKTAKQLSLVRQKIVKNITSEIEDVLKELGIVNAKFHVAISPRMAAGNTGVLMLDGKSYAIEENGIDEIEFFISTNQGEDLKPLSRTASGGEISRVMLALKSVLAKTERLPLLIFDEIDTGVSGRIAQKVGQTLHALATHHQIISITHLPQIAGLADSHYVVEKSVIEDRTVSSIRKIEFEEQVREVAKLLSGEVITGASLMSARELLQANARKLIG
ncbi:MAG: DNA repair protein RecN [Ignavibacteria bacterium]|nr:DNA repair protein RecN [Ignavibacteria bacterium]